MLVKRGRPLKYAYFIVVLEDGKLYSPATIVSNGEALGFFDGLYDRQLRLAKTRVRIALGRLRQLRRFPDAGDGQVKIGGQAMMPGWYGARWKAAIDIKPVG